MSSLLSTFDFSFFKVADGNLPKQAGTFIFLFGAFKIKSNPVHYKLYNILGLLNESTRY